jgi:hydroxyacyl-ACP dehydratase HTD2-like protein with hotdog domain
LEQATLEQWVDQPPLTSTVLIDRRDIARFAAATGETDRKHYDPDAGRQAGFADVVAPPLYYIALRTGVYNLVPQAELHAEGTPLRDIPPIQFDQAMAGQTRAELSKPFVAGDWVTCSRRVESFYEKEGRSGRLTFIEFEYSYTDADGKPFAVEHFTRIFR